MDETQNGVKKVCKAMGRPKKNLEAEERAKREVANSNERRRMQSINNGFSCLRQILRQHNNIEKHSKAAILHQSANYIKKLEEEINHFTEQNQMLKSFIDNYQKQSVSTQNCDQQTSQSLINDKEMATEDDMTSAPPKKRIRLSDEMQRHSAFTQSAGNPVLNKRYHLLQSPQGMTQSLEKEVQELRVLLERERQMRAGLEEKQRDVGVRLESNHLQQMFGVSSLVFPTNTYPLNPMLKMKSESSQSITGYHNFEDKPLNLTTKSSLNNYSIDSMQRMAQNNISLDLRTSYTSPKAFAVNVFPPINQFNKKENETHVRGETVCKGTHTKTSASHSQSSSFDQDEDTPLQLVKDVSSTEHNKTSGSTVFDQDHLNSDTQRLTSTTGTGFKENLEIIVRAIQHIEGEDVFSTSERSAYVKHLAQRFNFRSNSVLKHLLSDETNKNKCRPGVHSVNSLLK